jgi:hypothetical protein
MKNIWTSQIFQLGSRDESVVVVEYAVMDMKKLES